MEDQVVGIGCVDSGGENSEALRAAAAGLEFGSRTRF